MESLRRQLRYAVRRFVRAPVFTLVALLTLAAGIGANTAIFSVVNTVLLKPLPFPDPERLVGVWHTAPGLGFEEANQSPALYFTYRDENRVFEDTGMWDDADVTITGLAEPERVQALMVTDGTFPILRVQAALGRIFTPSDDLPGSPLTVVLSHPYWQRRFGGDPAVVGKSLTVNGRSREIIGVLPAGFRFLRSKPDVFLPFQFNRAEVYMGNFSYQGLARLKPGVTIEQANIDVARMIPMATERFPKGVTLKMLQEARFGPKVRPLKEDLVGDVGKVLWVLLGTVGMVLLIACANVANLFLVRAESRQQELAVRLAVGADRRRIGAQLLSESALLGVAGGACGVLLAYGGIRLLIGLGPAELPRLDEIGIDTPVLLFTLAISLFAGLLFGLFPVFKYARPDLIAALKEGGRASSDGRERHRARNALVVSQVALALVLLIGSGLMLRSFQALRGVQPGFSHPAEVLTLRISIPAAEVPDEEAAVRIHEQIQQRIEQIPGVTSVGLSSSITMDGHGSNDPVWVEGFPIADGQLPPIRRFKWVSENYFQTVGNPVLAGRSISWADIYRHADVVMVTENFARQYWSEPATAVGKRLRTGDDVWRQIIGVVGDEHDDGVGRPATPIVYWPTLLANFQGEKLVARRTMSYAIRTQRIGSSTLLREVQQAVWSINPNLPLAEVRTLDRILATSMAQTSFTLVMLGIAAAVALLLGVIGIYGVLSYTVSQRTREIGIRMALGAGRQEVSRLFVSQGLLLTGIGLLLGLGAAAGLTRLMYALLFGVRPLDFLTYGAVSLVLAFIALMASYVPARRAARVDPLEALRWE